ncbi:uncharacterized protein LOC121631055 isoform X2 [Melanotaenia boesemani]|uniref:uncharacterized protein LOC121631055 isoform X2 n=1 Tax=Melanotaenia boesemani TaxID=1250792 RepID=UPI001C04BB2A|nr:uncharacterized protein LOC121631055 isoform X2 [Melanotaenia boesemani]
MACRRGRQRLLPDCTIRHVPNSMDQLTSKYMMCKMESSTDSDSEVSPRWSDTSTLGCVSSASEHETLRQSVSLTYKSAGRHASYSLFLDPYDGSSEDSDESNTDAGFFSRQTRQQSKGGGGCRLLNQRKRFITHYPVPIREMVRDSVIDQQPTLFKDSNDVQMRCGSDSELWDCELDTRPSQSDRNGCRIIPEERTTESSTLIQTMDIELQLHDSGLHSTGSSTPQTSGLQTSVEGLNSCSERSASSCTLRSLCKRKGGLPGREMVELGPRKRLCVDMEDKQEEKENV